ncbi:amino acid ABC transporter substrate-binding protein [Oligoflexus tunisiensis]|uniref:amino acid ABC transporter substrate-binding protein n=1 Tax=Oligoflexus tunisiensis TaxID=708132 RepID=UPI00114CFCCC|nr:amino acid ABC transporter substrate-binding protein [Oligoflexus tunisiensis]
MRLVLFLSIWLFFACSLQAAPSIPNPVYVYGSEDTYDFRLNYTVAVVKAALDVDSEKLGPIEVRSTVTIDPLLTKNRAIAAITQDRGYVHVLSTMANRELDEQLLPIRISISASVLGEKIFIVRPDDREAVDTVDSLEELKKYTIGVGDDWADGPIMVANGLKTEVGRYKFLFPMLQGKRFDILTRGIQEAWDELRVRAFQNLDWQATWRLSYPAPNYLYVNKKQEKLAQRLTQGLREIERNGTLDELIVEHYGPAFLRSGWTDRRKIEIKNPYLPLQLPLHHASWKAWHKWAERKLMTWHKMSLKRFRPNWSGTYRPVKLIENQELVSAPRVPDLTGPPIVIRAAELWADTHILSAAFALELALSQEVNKDSIYYKRPVRHLTSKTLHQGAALQDLNASLPVVDAVATQGSMEREANFIGTQLDITQGLIGARVLVVNTMQAHMFRDVKSLESLRRFRICVGRDWPDRVVLEYARIPVFTAVTMPELFDALRRGKCDALTRAVYEVRDEMLSRPSDMLTVDPFLLLKYPAQQKVFVAKTRIELATAIELGLKSLQKNGVLAELLEVMYGDSLRQVQLDRRRVLTLENPAIFGKHVAGPYSWKSRL